MTSQQTTRGKQGLSGGRFLWLFLLGIVFLLVVLASYNLRRVVVHGHSMEPTFHNNQSVIVWTKYPTDALKIGDIDGDLTFQVPTNSRTVGKDPRLVLRRAARRSARARSASV